MKRPLSDCALVYTCRRPATAAQRLLSIFATTSDAQPSGRASRSRAAVRPERGSRRSGAISFSGTRTKARCARRG